MEYAAAKSTMCRQCGAHFVPSAPKLQAAASPQRRTRRARCRSVALAKTGGLLEQDTTARSSSVLIARPRRKSVPPRTSTICPKCSKHIDLRDYKITTSFSRSIRTHGQVHLTAKGDLSSSNVICRSALIEGKLRGNLHCLGHGHDQFCRQNSRTANGGTCFGGAEIRCPVFPAGPGQDHRNPWPNDR